MWVPPCLNGPGHRGSQWITWWSSVWSWPPTVFLHVSLARCGLVGGLWLGLEGNLKMVWTWSIYKNTRYFEGDSKETNQKNILAENECSRWYQMSEVHVTWTSIKSVLYLVPSSRIFCNYWKQLPVSPASQKDFSETGWMEINQIWKKHIWISCKKWTVFFPTPHQPFCCVPEWGRWKNNEALFVGIVGCVVMRLGFFLVTWRLWHLCMIENFGYVAAVSYPFGGIYPTWKQHVNQYLP